MRWVNTWDGKPTLSDHLLQSQDTEWPSGVSNAYILKGHVDILKGHVLFPKLYSNTPQVP